MSYEIKVPDIDCKRLVDVSFKFALEKIRNEPIRQEPFPHIYIRDIFPETFYALLLEHIENACQFEASLYPGVAVDVRADNFHDYGLTCKNFGGDPLLAAFLLEMESGRFSKALIEKFAAPNSWTGKGSAIPKEKFRFTENEDYNTVFDLHKDLPGYEITPHPDVASKIVTFLFYFTTDSSIAKHGTALCKPKDPDWVDDRSVPKSLPLRALLDRFLINGYGPYQKDAWHPWEDFDIVKVAEAHPNSFLSFAPNFSSYHGVRLDIRKDNPIQERLTLRGFIRAGSNSTNYMHDYGNGIMRRAFFRFSRFVTGRNKSALNSMRGTHD